MPGTNGMLAVLTPRFAALLKAYVDSVDVDAVGLDWMIDRGFARDEIQRRRPVQGNLDPLALLAGGAALDRETDPEPVARPQRAPR